MPDSTTQIRSEPLYLDNSATTFPKPPEVLQAMVHYATRVGASAGRGVHAAAQESGRMIRTCRERLNTLFNGENPDHFIFTLNCTDALNLAISGWLRPGDHVITTHMDHNSVLRPLNALVAEGRVTQTRVAVDPQTCIVDPDDIRRAITAKTRLIAVAHGSNVTGSLQPIGEIGRIARDANIPYLVDAAQTAGHVPIDVRADGIDFLAFPGHKGLLGPLGTGALYIRPGLEKELRPLRFGGTGSMSEQDTQPEFMPDKFEPGSHNAIGIAGLNAGVVWILDRGVANLFEHDRALSAAFIEKISGIDGLRFFGPKRANDRIGVFSIRIDGIAPQALARRLETEFRILTRAGLHCAPLAHRTIGTCDDSSDPNHGTTRLSFGPFVTVQDIQYAADALCTIALGNREVLLR